nr:unnamed protein product [Callosobruchus chinensis]
MNRQRQSDRNEHREGDTAVTEVHLQTGDGSIRILFASVYLSYDSVEAPPDHSDEEERRIRSEQGEARHTGAGCQRPPCGLGKHQHQQKG